MLRRFTVTFDLPHRRIFLQPNSHLGEPFRDNESGLSLLAKGVNFHRFEVDGVEAGSPAAAAGIREGDVLMRIGQHAASELDLAKIEEMLAAAGQTVPLTIQRKTGTIHTKIQLKERL